MGDIGVVEKMANPKESAQRRVYVLPTELVDRIVAFQNEKGLPSEVEAARRLLDEALKTRDTDETIIKRFLSRLKDIRIPSEVAKDVLVGHPLVTNIQFARDSVIFDLKGYGTFSIDDRSNVRQKIGNSPLDWRDWSDEIPF